jgi:hypothetical protein
MIDIQPHIDKLQALKEYMNLWIDDELPYHIESMWWNPSHKIVSPISFETYYNRIKNNP